jgi:hypothetical protein
MNNELPAAPAIQAVHHTEPAAQIYAVEAAEFVALQQAGFIERIIGFQPAEESLPQDPNEGIYLIKLNRIPKHCRDALCNGKELRRCREDLDRAGHAWKLPTGALVFVKPEQYRAAIESVAADDLKPDNVLFAESFEYRIEEALADFKQWAKQRTETHARAGRDPGLDASSEAATAGTLDQLYGIADGIDDPVEAIRRRVGRDELVIERTFVGSDDSLRRDWQSVTQSTTVVHGGINPRMIVPGEL